MNDLKKLCEELTTDIQKSYEEGVTMDEAERYASKLLFAQLKIADALKNADLDSRMKKTGVKSIKAAIYMQEATKGDKKPSDTFLQNLVDMNDIVVGEQASYDAAEVEHAYLQSMFNVFKEAHIHFRGISKGRFE